MTSLFYLLLACGTKGPTQANLETPTAPVQSTTSEPQPPPEPQPPEEPEAETDECFSACMKARQMEARAIEDIEADCARSCDPDSPKPTLEAPEPQ